jgi:hypothetical protein
VDTYDLARLASAFVLPLAEAIEDRDMEAALIADLGFVLPEGISLLAGVRQAVESFAGLAIELQDVDPRQSGSAADAVERAGAAFRAVATGLTALASTLDAAARDSPLVRETDVLERLPRRLIDYLCVQFTERHAPVIHELLQLFGLIIVNEIVQEEQPHRISFTERVVRWDRLSSAIGDPMARVQEEYGWGSAAGLEAERLFHRLRGLATSVGLHSDLRTVDDRARTAFDHLLGGSGTIPAAEDTLVLRVPFVPSFDVSVGAELYPVNDANLATHGLAIGVYVEGQLVEDVPLSDWLSARIQLGAYVTGFGVVVQPETEPQLLSGVFSDDPAKLPDSAAVDARVSFSLQSPDGNPIVLIGRAGASRLEAGAVVVTGVISNVPRGRFDAGCEVSLPHGVLAVQTGEGDGFLKKVIGEGFEVAFDLVAGVSARRGFYVGLGAALEYAIPIAAQAGPLSLDRITIAVKSETPKTSLVIGASGALALGPVTAVVDEVGLDATIDTSRPGLFGTADLTLGFKPPRGVGLAIATPMVVGGGFLFFDPAKGEYGGILQLEIAETVAVKAIGLITTRVDGASGFSLLVLITAEGFSPIPLGFGFTLQGLGGLFGVHRTVRVETLRGGIRDGTLGSVLFPVDPIRHAAQIVSDLRAVFPPAAGRFVFGPMAVIGWGTPTLLTLELALILELPQPVRVVILGRLTAMLPEPRAAVVQVRMDALGVVELQKREVALDATLYDSRILTFALTGDMALRARWGAGATFVLAIGGFNPRFAVPAGFPRLKRLALTVGDGSALRLQCACYLALTSNSVQFGARVELHASGGGFTLDGHLGIDALVSFEPFGFVVDIAAGVALRYHGHLLMGITLRGMVAGPSPWHVQGKATFKVLFFSVSVAFDRRIGDSAPRRAVPPVNVAELVAAAVRDAGNWSTSLPPGDAAVVTVREARPGGQRRAHPRAVLTVRQRVAPLGVRLERFGTAPIAGADRLVLTAETTSGWAVNRETDLFALGQFQAWSDAEQLTRPSFEVADAGLTLGGTAVSYAYDATLDQAVRYETCMVVPGQPDPADPAPPYELSSMVFEAVAVTGAAGLASIRRSNSQSRITGQAA